MLKEQKLLLNSLARGRSEKLLREERKILETGNLDWNYILREADYHRLNPLIYYHWRKEKLISLIPEGISARLEKKHYAVAFSNLKLSRELERLIAIFIKAGIEFIILKGPVLDEAIYPEKGLRPFGDLDIFIRRPDLDKMEDILLKEGYLLPAGILPKQFYRQFHFELPFVNQTKGGAYLEIHWDLLPRWRLHSPDIFEVWKRRQTFGENKVFYSLGIEDMIIYLCGHLDLHAYMNRYRYPSAKIEDYILTPSSGNRLIWFSDILETIRFFGERIDWVKLRKRAKHWGVETAVSVNLSILKQLFPFEGILETIDFSLIPRQGRVKKTVILLAEKNIFFSKKKRSWEKTLGFRGSLSWTDLIEYMFPGGNVLKARYRDKSGKMPLFYQITYRLKCLFEVLKGMYMAILK